MRRVPLFLFSFFAFSLFLAAVDIKSASAVSYYRDECANQFLPVWDLPAMIKEHQSSYENGKTAIFMFKSHTNQDNGRNVYTAMVGATTDTKFTMGFEESTLKAALYITGNYYSYTYIADEPKGAAYGYDSYYTSHNPDLTGYYKNAWFRVGSPSLVTGVTKSYAPDMGNAACYVTFMGNTDYAPSWHNRDFATLPNNLEYASSKANLSGCTSVLDIPCWFGYFFKPKSSDIQPSVDAINTTWNSKLGFVGDAVGTIGTVADALTGAAGSTCNSGGCTYSFGMLMGSPLAVDFAVVAKNWPTLWNFTTVFIRGITVIGLFFMIRRKIVGVMAK